MRRTLLKSAIWAVVASVAAISVANTGFAATITQWDFSSATHAAPYNSPPPTTGSGTAQGLGMTNAYNGGNTESDDVTATPGTANPGFSENAWRVRGSGHNGWATNAAGAPQYSQGAEFDGSTVGYKDIQFSFDWYSTAEGIRDLQFQYNTNTANAAGWTNFGGTSPTGTYIANSKDWYNQFPTPGVPMIDVDLSSIVGANNNPNFGIRLVAAFDSTGNVASDYAGAGLMSGSTVIYNNSSGNWRFANLTFSGSPVPEPASIVLTILGFSGLLVRSIRRVG